MDKLVIGGGKKLRGSLTISGAKNVALKACVASLLTDEPVTITNVPDIADVSLMLEVVRSLGVDYRREGGSVVFHKKNGNGTKVPLDVGARLRTSSMVIGPLLARFGSATIPNPGGCRLGARPIDRHIEGLERMGATIDYHSDDGYFYAAADGLTGIEYTFEKNTHTGTETLILAAVLARGVTTLKNAAQEVEIDDLIALLVSMGANIDRTQSREIRIEGVESLHGTTYDIMGDRNEEVTYAIAAALTDGDVTVHRSEIANMDAFIDVFEKAGGGYEQIDEGTTRYFRKRPLVAVDVTTQIHPGFMTDWQAPWAVLMTQATGESHIHETVFERRFSYVSELKKMGANITFYTPDVEDPETFYNFNWSDKPESHFQGITIVGPSPLHNAVMSISDLRAGATLVLAALVAEGMSYIYGVDQIDRGYEAIEKKLAGIGADIQREKEEQV